MSAAMLSVNVRAEVLIELNAAIAKPTMAAVRTTQSTVTAPSSSRENRFSLRANFIGLFPLCCDPDETLIAFTYGLNGAGVAESLLISWHQ
jgi:hypothetical protein